MLIPHELCSLFPLLVGYDFECLKLDIKTNGQQEPIVLHDGKILDGMNRYRACLEVGIKPSFMKYSGDSIATYVLSANLHRRHLTPGQQASIVACVQDWGKAQKVGKPKSGNVTGLDTTASRQAASGASDKTQRNADKVAKADPELAKQVARGEVTLPQAVKKVSKKTKQKKSAPPPGVPAYDPAEEALANAHDEVIALSEKVQTLEDAIAVGNLPKAEQSAGEIIKELRAKVKTLEATIAAITVSRDTFQRENNQLQKQCKMQANKIKKLESGK